ncbi:hypothetical protein M9Y10_014126 [Tritrichomonas musculus]|uniref:Nucleoporin Nup133/Nup155-like N-terminal domain-containing protein n=1 Tax=Tritrichomonas musculus TaxID=1915356 RepID=A0ABR2KYN6_9EUKA
MDITKASLSSKNNTSRAILHINECVNYDNNIKEFFTILGETEDVGYYRTHQDGNVSATNIFSLNSTAPFPSIVKTHYMFSEKIAVCGILPKIQRYYYILDNKLFLWHTNNKAYSDGNVEQIVEEEKVILAVSTMERGRDQFFTKAVDSLLAVATATYIKIYPIQDDIINPGVFYTVKISFTPTCLCSGSWDTLFIGAADGQLYSLQFLATPGGFFNPQVQENIKINKLTAWTITNVLISFFSFSVAPIAKICFDSTTNLLATIDNTQRIHIYSYSGDSLSSEYSYTPPKDTEFVAISPVYLSDSQFLRFVAFTSKGERYFFGNGALFSKKTKIALRGERKAPDELQGETVVDAFFLCGYTVFVCKNSVVGTQVINIDSENCYECIGKSKLSGYGICIATMEHALAWSDSRIFHAPIINQHFMEPIEFLVLTSNGGCSIKIRPPCHFVRQQFITNRFLYNENTNEVMKRYEANDESCAMCLLLSSLYPEESDHYIFIASEYNRLQTQGYKIEEDEEDVRTQDQNPPEEVKILSPQFLTPMTHAFYIRAQRLIQFMWESSIFYRARDDLIKVTPQFSASYPDILKRLSQLIELSQKYLTNFDHNMDKLSRHQQALYDVEKGQLDCLSKFLSELIEILKFIRILRKQKATLLTMPIANLDKKVVARLIDEALAPPTPSGVYLITALQQYAIGLITSFKNMIDTQSKTELRQYQMYDSDLNTLTSISPPTDIHQESDNQGSLHLSKFQQVSQQIAADPWLKMESTLDLLTIEINEECPTFLMSPESLVIRAFQDLKAATKEPNHEEKKKLAHNATKIFLSNINVNRIDGNSNHEVGHPSSSMWCGVCCSLIELGFDVYAVKIAAARAHYIDEAQRGYYWYVNGCNEQEKNSMQMFNEVSKIYESAFDASYSTEGLTAILDSNDELFILLVYQHLLKTNQIENLLNLDNDLVLDFLRENDPKLVWKYYVAHDKYKEAIINLIKYASDTYSAPAGDSDIKEITFDQRIECLQLASNLARSKEFNELAEEARIRIECAKIQKEMAGPDIVGEPLKDLSILFTEADRSYRWSYLLRLISLMTVDNFRKTEMDLNTAWAKFLFCGDGSNVFSNIRPSEFDVNNKLKKLFSQIGPNKIALDPFYLVSALEDYSDYVKFRPEWAVETLTSLNINGSELYKAYVTLMQEELEDDRMNQLIFAALWLLSHSFKGDIELIRDKVKKVLKSSKNPFYDEIKNLMNLLE